MKFQYRWILHLKWQTTQLFVEQYVQDNNSENIEAPYHWSLWWEYTGDPGVTLTEAQ